MKTYIADIIPRIQRFSQRLDDLTKLTNQHWVSLGDINESKRVFIFRANNQLLISENGIVEKGSWEYLGNQSLLLDTKSESYLLKHGFFDENVIALKLDSTDTYAFFVNENKFHGELNTIDDVLRFLERNYLSTKKSGLGATKKETLDTNAEYGFRVVEEKDSYDIVWGHFKLYEIKYFDGKVGQVYKGASTGKYFYMHLIYGRKYFDVFEETVLELYLYLKEY